jgi:Zn-dependent M32 family carboxypeptidase
MATPHLLADIHYNTGFNDYFTTYLAGKVMILGLGGREKRCLAALQTHRC